jgi:MFS family permease
MDSEVRALNETAVTSERTLLGGWYVVFAAMAAMIPSTSAITFYSQNFLVGPVTAEFGWARSQFLAPVSIGLFIAALLPPVVGYAADRWGTRRVQAPLLLLYGASTVCLAFLGSSIVAFAIVAAFGAICSVGQSPVMYTKVVAQRITRRRGVALGIATSGLALGNIIFPPVTHTLVDSFGWRAARVALGASILFVALPIVWFGLREQPSAASSRDDKAAPAYGLSWGDSIRTREFKLINVALFLASMAINAHIVNFVLIVRPHGVSTSSAALALSAMAFCMFCGRIISGLLLDAVNSPKVGALWFGCAAAGALMLQTIDSVAGAFASAGLLGLALGAEIELAAYYVTRFFGLPIFGKLYGVMLVSFSTAAALGPLVLSLGYDWSGSYKVSGITLSIVAAAACALLMALPSYRFAARR